MPVAFDTIPPSDTITTGKPDTLRFSASTNPTGGAIVFTAESQPVLDISGLRVITSGFNATVIITTPRDTVYNVTVTAKSGTVSKSATVILKSEKESILKETSALFKQDTVTLGTIEGKQLSLPLVSYLTDTTVQLISNKGTVNNKTLAYTVPSGSAKDTVIITAQKNSNSSQMKIYLNITVTEMPKFTVAYHGNGNTGGTVPSDVNLYPAGAKVTVSANTGLLVKTGTVFTGWNTLANGTGTAHPAGSEFTMGSADVTFFAQWTVNTVEPSIVIPPQDISIAEGQTITLTVTATGNPACTFQWKKSGSETIIGTESTLQIKQATLLDSGTYIVVVTNSVKSVESSAMVTILPTYSLTLTLAPPAGCSVIKNKDTAVYVSGSTVTLTASAPAGSGYRFDKWSGDTTAKGNILSIIMNKNRSITPVFVKQYTLTITTSDATKGTVSSTTGSSLLTVDSGTAVPVTATPKNWYKFKQWSVLSGQATIADISTASTSVNVSGDAMIQAKFGCITFRKDFPADYSLVSIVQGDDGSYGVLVHQLTTTGNELIVKLNTNGDSLWEKTICNLGVFDESDAPIPIKKITNGFLTGRIGFGNTPLVVGVSLDSNSTQHFTWDPETDLGVNFDIGCALMTNDGGFVLAGRNNDQTKGIIIKTDASRQKIWTVNIDSLNMITDCKQTHDNGFIIVEKSSWVIKINNTGTIIDFSTKLSDMSAISVCQISETEGYVVGGQKTYSGPALIKLLPNGSIASGWPKIYTDCGSSGSIVSVRITSDGNYVFATGEYYVKTDPNGQIIWKKKLSGNTKYIDICKDGGFIIVSDSWIIKTDENGDTD